MNTFEKTESIRDLVEYYCCRCNIGIYNCKISAAECLRIRGDADFLDATRPSAIAATTRFIEEDADETTEDLHSRTDHGTR